MQKSNSAKIIANNKKAYHDYYIDKKYEAGIVLLGWEVKSARAARINIKDAYVLIKNNEAWLINAHISVLNIIPHYLHADPLRTRKLLLNSSEIRNLYGLSTVKGYSILPIAVYWKNNKVKLEIGLGKGKKQHDKRDVQKEKDWLLEKQRVLKRRWLGSEIS